MMGVVNEQHLRNKLVSALRRGGWLSDDRVAEAFASVPRHVFVPDQPLREVYTNRSFITKQLDGFPVSSSSEPAIMAVMVEELELEPGHRVLEIGAGTGYNAALLSRLVGKSGSVTSIDIDAEVAQKAEEHLWRARGRSVVIAAADGGYGHAAGAPYDRIVATASCWQIPPAWIDQLVVGGLIVLPLRLNGMHASLALRKQGRELVSERAAMCGFMVLRGAFGQSVTTISANGTVAVSEIEVKIAARRALERTLTRARSVRVRFPRARDARNWPLHYLALQGKPILGIY